MLCWICHHWGGGSLTIDGVAHPQHNQKGCNVENSTNIPDMIANPQDYGFAWEYGPLNKGGMELTDAAPYMVHQNLTRMREVFGDDYFLNMANGTSGKVRDQLLRNDIFANRDILVDDVAMKTIILQRAFGAKKPRASRVTVVEVEKLVEVEVRIYMADDGQEFTDKAEFMAHQIDLRQNA